MGVYSTTSQANGLYQTLIDMANYSTTAIANGLYQSLTDMANYSTTAQANGLYVNKSNFIWRLADIAFPQVLDTGESQEGQFVLTNFTGSQGNTAYIMVPGNYPNSNPPIGGNHSNFTASVGFLSATSPNTTVSYFITNNGAATAEDLQIYFLIFAYNE